ncbi:MAG TPA: class I SAM-dependent methyltransferase [Nitrososphaerales archaeon]|nr:class I SAM-dependent methyltransferase [Nitrososphaerales archaeon]
MTTAGEDPKFGLKEDWPSIQKTLEEIVPVYDRTNRYISLGTDLKLRRKGLELLEKSIGKPSFRILDLGCGTGRMSVELLADIPIEKEFCVLLDPIKKMMEVARFKTGLEGFLAVFENTPFRAGVFDAAMAGFAIRDAKNLSKAIEDVSKLLKTGGKFLIVDLSKPDSELKTSVIGFYWRAFAPMLAFFSSGMLGLKFAALAKTFQRLPKNSELLSLLKHSGFNVVTAEYSMMGGVCLLLLSKESGNNFH